MYTDSGGQHGYVRDPKENFTTFDFPGSPATLPGSINAGGAVTALTRTRMIRL